MNIHEQTVDRNLALHILASVTDPVFSKKFIETTAHNISIL